MTPDWPVLLFIAAVAALLLPSAWERIQHRLARRRLEMSRLQLRADLAVESNKIMRAERDEARAACNEAMRKVAWLCAEFGRENPLALDAAASVAVERSGQR